MTVIEWLLESDPAIRWLFENPHPDQLDIDLAERQGEASRWVTLSVLRVRRWAGGAGLAPATGSPSA